MSLKAENDPRRWYSTNLVGLPAGLIASADFNQHPQTLTIHGTREMHRGLFTLLDSTQTLNEAAEVFQNYMQIAFNLKPKELSAPSEKNRHHSSYLKLLEGWGFDSNSPQGAVLKGWVESRFGITPNFHQTPLERFPSEAWVRYLEQKHSSRFHNNSIHAQLDLMFEYCQWASRRFVWQKRDSIRLWRGVNLNDGQIVIEGSFRTRQCTVQLNNLVSFTACRERADEFGDWILEAQVPRVKLLYFPGMLKHAPLAGEEELLVLGGDFYVTASTF